MFREILVASGNRLTLELPDDLVGRGIEVLAFALPPAARRPEKQSPRPKWRGARPPSRPFLTPPG